MSFLLFLIAVLPVILIGIYIYRKDRIKESSKLLFKLFMGGVGSCFPAVIFGLIIGFFFPKIEDMNFVQMFTYVLIDVAFVEELFKWLFLYKISYNNSEFDSFYDMIVYASFVSLGFACFENILYVMESGILTGILRAITAVPGHVCDGILMGSYLSLAKINQLRGNKSVSNKYKIFSVIIPVITHTIYDFCLFWASPIFVIIFIIFVITLFIICVRKVINVSRNNIKFKRKYCTNCGTLVSMNYCSICGKKNE